MSTIDWVQVGSLSEDHWEARLRQSVATRLIVYIDDNSKVERCWIWAISTPAFHVQGMTSCKTLRGAQNACERFAKKFGVPL